MVPEHRLETLLEQATTLQRISCLYHNSSEYISLYSNHVCDRYYKALIIIIIIIYDIFLIYHHFFFNKIKKK